jgi:hypothetical protein
MDSKVLSTELISIVRRIDNNFMTHKTVIDPKGWVRGVQPQNAGFGEMAEVMRWMGASESDSAEWTRTGEWFGVEWGWA